MNDTRQQRIRAYPLGTDYQRAINVDGGTGDFVAAALPPAPARR